MDTELWVNAHQQMYMVRHDFEGLNGRLMLLAYLSDDLLQAFIYPFDQDLAPVLGTPHDMIVTTIGHIMV